MRIAHAPPRSLVAALLATLAGTASAQLCDIDDVLTFLDAFAAGCP